MYCLRCTFTFHTQLTLTFRPPDRTEEATVCFYMSPAASIVCASNSRLDLCLIWTFDDGDLLMWGCNEPRSDNYNTWQQQSDHQDTWQHAASFCWQGRSPLLLAPIWTSYHNLNSYLHLSVLSICLWFGQIVLSCISNSWNNRAWSLSHFSISSLWRHISLHLYFLTFF